MPIRMEHFVPRRVIILLADSIAVLAAFVLAFLLRFEFALSEEALEMMKASWLLVLGIHYVVAHAFGLYRGIYYFSSFPDLIRIVKAVGAAALLLTVAVLFVRQGRFPRSVLLLHPVLSLLGLGAVRFGIRLIKTRMRSGNFGYGDKNLLLVGAGELGESLLRQIQKTPDTGYNVIGFVDDDKAKWGLHIHDVPVLGGRGSLAEVVERLHVDEIIIAIGTQRGSVVRAVVESLRGLEKKPEIKIAPALDEMLRTPTSNVAIRKVKPADLLNRGEIQLDEPGISRVIEQKVVLVSGAGGTIGAELCRQALKYRPEKLILLENHATSLFYREEEMRDRSQGSAIVSALGDVRDQAMLERVFSQHRPHVVFHAAAHKHVHQLEFNVPEAVGNNVIGTYRLARAASEHKAEVFLLISTDKAVVPSSVMGATKQVAEQVVRIMHGRGETVFTGVRFGNVLGSSGSVLRIFSDQIERGGPITVTDARATRYFMTVEESVGLILQAVSMAKGGEVYVLKMGTPVRIIDMAQNLVMLSGLEVGKDIEIRITGLKQGEKLGEKLSEDPAGVLDSQHPDVFVLNSASDPGPEFEKRILDLEIACRGVEVKPILRKLQELVPTFSPASEHRLAEKE